MNSNGHLWCITKNRTNPAYEGARIGAARVAQRMGFDLTNVAPEVPDDPAEQEALLRKALESQPDAILIAPAHPRALTDTLREVAAAEIPLIYFVSGDEIVKPSSFITADNYVLACGIAEFLIDALEGKGALAVIEGSYQSPTTAPRTTGFLDAAAGHPHISVVARQSGNYHQDDARKAMTDILRRHSAIDGILVANDYMAMGVNEAVSAAGRIIPTVGVNAMPDAIRAIREGTLYATAAYDAMKMACIACEAAVRILSGLSVPAVIELPVEIVHAGNCEAWGLPYEERALPDWGATTDVAFEVGGPVSESCRAIGAR